MTVLLCETKSRNDTGIGFGGFLLNEGEIDEHDLERALSYQRVEHVAIGVLAVREKYLSERQLCDVKGHQRERGGLFGEIAIELGLLSEGCVNVLLMMQKGNNRRIGEILVMLGSVKRDDMESHLQMFHA
jgi:hypothetical protein